MKGAGPAQKFTTGLCNLGLGEMVEVSNGKKHKIISFRRFHPYDNTISKERRNKAGAIWNKLNIDIELTEENKENDLMSSQKLEEVVNNLKQSSGGISENAQN